MIDFFFFKDLQCTNTFPGSYRKHVNSDTAKFLSENGEQEHSLVTSAISMITPLLGAHFLYGNSYDARKATLGSQSKGLVWTENRSQKQILLGSGHHLVSDYSTSKTPQGRRNYRRKKNEVFVFGPTKEGILNEHIRRQGYRNQRTMFHFLAKGQLWTYKLGDMRVIGRKQLFLSFE